ncbi:hypothetical protein M885DRAFT_620865, partial [Pelagophyceae sp. CCMP2097]
MRAKAAWLALSAPAAQGALFFSEYAGGSYIEIHNNGESPPGRGDGEVDLAAYGLQGRKAAGYGTTVQSHSFLKGALVQPKGVFVVCDATAAPQVLAKCDETFDFGAENYCLVSTGATDKIVYDCVGDAGGDVCGEKKDATLVRKASVTAGALWGESAARESCQWHLLPQTTFAYVGSHPHPELDGPQPAVVHSPKLFHAATRIGPPLAVRQNISLAVPTPAPGAPLPLDPVTTLLPTLVPPVSPVTLPPSLVPPVPAVTLLPSLVPPVPAVTLPPSLVPPVIPVTLPSSLVPAVIPSLVTLLPSLLPPTPKLPVEECLCPDGRTGYKFLISIPPTLAQLAPTLDSATLKPSNLTLPPTLARSVDLNECICPDLPTLPPLAITLPPSLFPTVLPDCECANGTAGFIILTLPPTLLPSEEVLPECECADGQTGQMTLITLPPTIASL